MSASTTFPARMTADEFLRREDTSPAGRKRELHNGEVVEKVNERAIRGQTKVLFVVRLAEALAAARLPCQVFTSEIAVRIDDFVVYEPDVVVRCGRPLDPDALFMTDPVIIVEIHSPSTSRIDTTTKAERYLAIDSLRHYLTVNATTRRIIHHQRTSDGTFRTTLLGDGPITLDPPGIIISDLFPPAA